MASMFTVRVFIGYFVRNGRIQLWIATVKNYYYR